MLERVKYSLFNLTIKLIKFKPRKAENLDVVMYVEKYDKWFFYINYLEPCDSVLTLDAYKVIVTYHYPDEIDKLLEYDKKTKFGEEVGDKI